ncbi:MAG: hypothetical protein OSJ27_09870 [Candidatus Gastranaerophilales bacterium]|nr:hypothetical protein [Candidatus Gastranaerophilales bacterium]
MRMLDILYSGITDKIEVIDSEEYIESVEKILAFLEEISLDLKKSAELENLILATQATAERQGFEFGFKYAMSLIKECGL